MGHGQKGIQKAHGVLQQHTVRTTWAARRLDVWNNRDQGEWVTGQGSVGGATEPDFSSDFPGQQLLTDVYIMTARPKEEAS